MASYSYSLGSHQLVSYEKDVVADLVVDTAEPPTPNRLMNLEDVTNSIGAVEVNGMHDTQVLGPNTRVRIRMRHRTWDGPFVFHCHTWNTKIMRMMFNFEPVPSTLDKPHDPTRPLRHVLTATTVTWKNTRGELPWSTQPCPRIKSNRSEYLIQPRKSP